MRKNITAPRSLFRVERYGRNCGKLSGDNSSIERFARNRESFLMFGWSPTLYNPKLRQRLHRIKQPTLVLWGEDDRIVSPAYGREFAAAIPGATFDSVPGVGHYGYVEKPAEFAKRTLRFLGAA